MRATTLIAILAICLLPATASWAQEEQSVDDLMDHVADSCRTEIDSYCSQVTLGEGRLLACFYAHQDKLSGRCEYALYETSAKLEEFATAVTHIATECADDLEEFCSQVQMGEGRVGLCLLENKEQVSDSCRMAMDDTGLVALDEE